MLAKAAFLKCCYSILHIHTFTAQSQCSIWFQPYHCGPGQRTTITAVLTSAVFGAWCDVKYSRTVEFDLLRGKPPGLHQLSVQCKDDCTFHTTFYCTIHTTFYCTFHTTHSHNFITGPWWPGPLDPVLLMLSLYMYMYMYSLLSLSVEASRNAMYITQWPSLQPSFWPYMQPFPSTH